MTPHTWYACRQCSFDPATDKHTHNHLFRKTLLSVEGKKSDSNFRSLAALTQSDGIDQNFKMRFSEKSNSASIEKKSLSESNPTWHLLGASTGRHLAGSVVLSSLSRSLVSVSFSPLSCPSSVLLRVRINSSVVVRPTRSTRGLPPVTMVH